MANKAKLNDASGGGTVGYLQTIRIPLFYQLDTLPNTINLSSSLSSFAENAFFEIYGTEATGVKKYRARKRPGLSYNYNPTPGGVGGAGRGIYIWNNRRYTVIGTTLYSETTALYTSLSNTFTSVGIIETHPNAVTQYLCVNDGTQLLLIDTSDNVLVMNNVVINTSSVAAASVITTATAHNLVTGNRVIIRNHVGSTPSINGTIYTVTVLSPTTFSIPVNVTVAGTGGTIGVFPTNVGCLEDLDGYMFTGQSNGRIYNCEFNDPTTWGTAAYIVAQMENDSLITLGKQGNYISCFKEKTTQFFYDTGNGIIGSSPLANVDQSMQQYGCAAPDSVVSLSNTMYWIGNSKNGGYTIYSIQGSTNIQEIGTPIVNTILNYYATQYTILYVVGSLISVGGSTFYVLSLQGANPSGVIEKVSSLAYCEQSKTWTTFKNSNNNFDDYFPIFYAQKTTSNSTIKSYLWALDPNSGNVYILNPVVGTDYFSAINANMLVKFSLPYVDLDTMKRKFWERAEIVGRDWVDGTLTLLYTDTDHSNVFLTGVSRSWTISATAMDNRFWARALGNSRRRNWALTHSGAQPGTIYECLEFDVRISEY